MPYKLLKELSKKEIEGKKFLIRVDFNVPIDENGIVKDYTRILAVLDTIKYVISNGGKAILCSHLGRPKGKVVKDLTLRPVGDTLAVKINKRVDFVDECIGPKVAFKVERMNNGEILLLENLRFHEEEEGYAKEQNEKNIDFAKELAKHYDYFVNDAFAAMHRAHASIVGVVKEGNLQSFAGFLVEKELKVLLPMINPGENSIAIIGGGKLKEKIGSLDALCQKYSRVLVGGVVSNVFLATRYAVGNSLINEKKDDTDYKEKAKNLLDKYPNIILPKRCVIARQDYSDKKIIDIVKGVPFHYSIFDDIIEQDVLNEISQAKVVVWCGPIGLFEKGFKEGNLSVGKALAANKSRITVIGGGETAEAAGKVKVSHVSTGGGATLELLRYGTLPGIDALEGKF